MTKLSLGFFLGKLDNSGEVSENFSRVERIITFGRRAFPEPDFGCGPVFGDFADIIIVKERVIKGVIESAPSKPISAAETPEAGIAVITAPSKSRTVKAIPKIRIVKTGAQTGRNSDPGVFLGVALD